MEYAQRYLGLLVPSADLVVEQDFRNTLPPHVGTHVARMFQGREPVSNLENLQRILDAAETAAELVSHAKPELVVFCGTSASFMHGRGSDEELSAASPPLPVASRRPIPPALRSRPSKPSAFGACSSSRPIRSPPTGLESVSSGTAGSRSSTTIPSSAG